MQVLWIFQLLIIGYVQLQYCSGQCILTAPPPCSNEVESGSGNDLNSSCPVPICVNVTVLDDLSKVLVTFQLDCIPLESMNCVYNYTVSLSSPSNFLLDSDGMELPHSSITNTSFTILPSTNTFEEGIIITVAIQLINGNSSEGETVVPGGFAPSIIQLNVTDVLNTSLTLSWELPYDIEPDMYNITYNYTELSGTTPRTGMVNLQIAELNVTDSMTDPVTYSYNLTDLFPYSVYDISVISIYEHEESKPLTIQAQTTEGVSSPVVNLNVVAEQSSKTLDITWEEPAYPAGIIRQYKINIARFGDGTMMELYANMSSLSASSMFEFYVNYSITVTPINDFGEGESSEMFMIVSPEGKPTSPRNFTVDQIENNSFSLHASWVEPTTLNGVLANYTIFCRTSATQFYSEQIPNSPNNFILVDTTGPDITEVTITGRSPFTEYECYVTASTGGGESEPSNNDSAKTDEAAPDGPPQNFVATVLSSSSVRLEWTRPSVPNGEITTYLLEYSNDSMTINISLPVDFIMSSDEYNVTNITIEYLNEFTNYTFSLRAVTAGGSGPLASDKVLTDEAAPSGIPLILTGSNSSSTSLYISWSLPNVQDRNGIILGYNISYTSGSIVNNTSTSETFINITGLMIYTQYDISVAAYTSVGTGPADYITVRTDSSVPSSPLNLNYMNITSTSVEVSWLQPSSFNGPNEGYVVMYTRLETDMTNSTARIYDTSVNITDLEIYEEYYIVVLAFTDKGSGTPSETLRIRTDEDSPTSPRNFSLTVSSSTEIQATWVEPTTLNGVLANYTVFCRTSTTQFYSEQMPNSSNNFILVNTTGPDITEVTITGRSPFTEYECYVTASTGGGESEPSNNDSAKTDEAAPDGPPQNFVATVLSSSSVRLEWTRPSVPNGEITKYLLEYSNDSMTINISLPVDFIMSSDEYNVTNITIEYLNEFTNYTFSLRAVTAGGSGPLASDKVLTDEAAPSGIPLNLTGSNSSSTSLYISWSLPNVQDRNGIILGYNISYTSGSIVNNTSTSETFINITGLMIYTQYDISVAAYTSVGTGPADYITVRTDSSVPSSPLNLNYMNITSTSVEVSWLQPSSFNGPNEGYVVMYTRLETDVTNSTARIYDTSVNITDLEIYEEYYIVVLAFTDKGSGTPSETLRIRTDEDLPGLVSNFLANEINMTAISVQWSSPQEPNGVIIVYEVEYTLVTGSNITMRTNFSADQFQQEPFFITLTNLTVFSEYDIRVRAYTSRGAGGFTNVVAIRTDPAPSSPPTSVITNVMRRSILLQWSEPDNPHGDIAGYYILTNASFPSGFNNTSLSIGLVLNVSSDVLSINFTDLSPYTQYIFSVAAYSFLFEDDNNMFDIVMGMFSEPLVSQTLQDISTSPRNFSLTVSSSTEIQATWVEPTILNGVLANYTVFCRTSASQFYSEQIPNSPNNFILVNTTGPDITEVTITGRSPFTEYECYVTASTGDGESEPSNNDSAKTDEAAPDGPPQNFVATVLSSSSVRLEWTRPSVPNGEITTYLLEYSNDSMTINISLPVKFIRLSDEYNVTNITIEYLNEFTNYTFNLRAVTAGGSGPLASTGRILTDEAAPSGIPLNLTGSNSSSTSLYISWSLPSFQDRNGIILGYSISYTSGSIVNNTSTSETFINITGLMIYTQYNISVAAYTSAGTGPTVYITVRTDSSVPSSPLSLTYMNITSTSVKVSWSQPSSFNGPNEGYVVMYTRLETSMTNSTARIYDTSVNITGLEIYEEYDIVVLAFTDKGSGTPSETLRIRTDEDLPGLVSNFLANEINMTAISVQWSSPEEPNGVIIVYEVEYTLVTGSNITMSKNFSADQFQQEPFFITLTNLTVFSEYDIRVRAYTSRGAGGFTNVVAIRTDPAPSSPPTSVITYVMRRSVLLQWSEPDNPHGDIAGYYILTNASFPSGFNNASLSIGLVLNVSSDVLSINFTDLSPYTQYSFSVAAYSFLFEDDNNMFDIVMGMFSEPLVSQTLQDISTSPRNFSLTVSSSTEIQATWEEPTTLNGVLANYTVFCRTSASQFYSEQIPNSPNNFILVNTTGPDITEVTITGRSPFTEYECYVTASTGGGESEPSNNDSAKTDEAAPDGPPQNFVATVLSSSSVRLEWTRPSVPNGEITTYLLEYSNDSMTINISLPVDFIMSSDEYNVTNITIEYLNEFTNYTFSLRAVTAGGSGPLASDKVLTDEAAPSGIPLNLTGSNSSSTSLYISWLLPSFQDRNGIILGYNISYTSGSIVNNTSTSETFINITGLMIYTQYNISVAAYTSVGTGPTVYITVRTDSSVPSSPLSLTYMNITSTSVKVSWLQPSSFNGPDEGYVVMYTRLETDMTISTARIYDTSVNITGLEIYEEYDIVVLAFTDKGPGTPSETLRIRTDEDSPTSPRNFSLTVSSSTEIQATWVEPTTLNGVLANYTIFCRTSTTQFYSEQIPNSPNNFILVNTTGPDITEVTITGRSPFTEYECYVTASTGGGESEPSNNDSAKTDEAAPDGPPQNFVATVLSSSSVRLEWTRPSVPNGEITTYLLEYSNDSMTINISLPVKFIRSSDEYNVTNITIEYLNEFTNYTFNLRAVTAGGRGPLASTGRILTDEAAPSGIPLILTGSNSSSTSLYISWSLPNVQDRNGIILGYNISYTSGSIVNNTSTSETFINITGLMIYTQYNISVAAYTSAGTGPAVYITVRTDSAPSGPPVNLSIQTVNATALSVSWFIPQSPNGMIESYYIQYNLQPLYQAYLGQHNDTMIVQCSVYSVILDNLYEFAGYNVTIQANNDKGLGEVAMATGMTSEDVPSAGVLDVDVIPYDSTTVNVSWTPPARSNWNGLLTYYTIEYFTDDSNIVPDLSGMATLNAANFTNNRDPRSATSPLSKEFMLINGLEEYVYYSFTVTIATSIGPNPQADTPNPISIATLTAAPNGPPSNINITILSSLQARINWALPPYLERNGIITYYLINISDTLDQFKDLINVTSTWYIVNDLPQFAVFNVSVAAATSAGIGPYSGVVSDMTLEGLPSAPNVTVYQVGSSSLGVFWREPESPNGNINGYYIFYYGYKDGDSRNFDGLNKNLSVTITNPILRSYNLTGLVSDSYYSVNVTAFTRVGNGTTGIGQRVQLPTGPPPPVPSNATIPTSSGTDDVSTETTINIAFIIPPELNANGDIERVIIVVKLYISTNDTIDSWYYSNRARPRSAAPPWQAIEESISNLRQRGLVTRQSNGGMEISQTIGTESNCGPDQLICNGPLEPDTQYQFKYRAYTSGDLFSESEYSGPISTDPTQTPTATNPAVIIAVVIVLIVLIVIIVVIVVVVICIIKRKKKQKYSFAASNGTEELILKEKGATLTNTTALSSTDPSIVPLSENKHVNPSTVRSTSVKATPNSRKIYLRDLNGYVTDMLSDSGFKFSEEYEKVSGVGLDHSKDASLMPENRAKNRYTNILAYDHSRVKLDSIDDDPGSDYINANYIPGYRMRRAYIATQGPLPSTFDDFWRMIWEQNCYIVVMLTQLVERGRTKCHRYWPGSQPEVYGEISVDMLSEKEFSDWIIRKFKLSKEKRSRIIHHYQFVSWPDHGVPEQATAALDFVRAVHEIVQPLHGPIAVHCSAGVGRTGTFIALGSLLQHIKDHDWIDIFGLSCEMRQHRNHMIQTEAQYVFIHKAMLEICESRSSFSASKHLSSFSPIYANIGVSSPGISQQSDMFGDLLSEEASSGRAYDESRF